STYHCPHYSFFLSSYLHHRDLHSFPTRRSSDLSKPTPRPSFCAVQPTRFWLYVAPTSTAALRIIGKGAGRLDCHFYVAHPVRTRSEEHTSELQSRGHLVCRLLLEKKKNKDPITH